MKHNTRLVAIGFLCRKGLDYFEVFVHVAIHEIIRMVMALTCNRSWTLSYIDEKFVFLNDPLEEVLYVSQPLVFEVK